MFKIYFNKTFGIGFAFAINNIVSDDILRICKYVNIKIYVLFWLVVAGFRITPWQSYQLNSK